MQVNLGVFLALVAAFLVADERVASTEEFRIGRIGTWVLHADELATEEGLQAHVSLLSALSPSTEVIVALPAFCEACDYGRRVGDALMRRHRYRFVTVDSDLTAWARDRYVIFKRRGGRVLLVQRDDAVDVGRRGDVEAGHRVAEIVGRTEVVHSRLRLEGGNVILSGGDVLVGAGVVAENAANGMTRDEVLRELEETFDRRPVVIGSLDERPPHDHIDMFLSVVGPRKVFVGDPRTVRGYLDLVDDLGLEGPSLGEAGTIAREAHVAMEGRLAAVEDSLRVAGYEIVGRLPLLYTNEGGVLTWTNVVLEDYGRERRVYLPEYGLPMLDRAAQRAWADAGYRVIPVGCRGVIGFGGAVRCLTNVLRD